MDKPFEILASINSNVYGKSYGNNNKIQLKREQLFDIVEKYKATKTDKRVYRGHMPSSYFNYENRNGNYTLNQSIEKIKKLKDITKNGSLYVLDIETLGKAIENPSEASSIDIFNKNIFSATEIAISKQQFKDGKPVGEAVSHLNFASSPNNATLKKFIGEARFRKDADSTTLSSITRLSGYSGADNFKDGKPTKWIGNAKINNYVFNPLEKVYDLDFENANKGISLLSDPVNGKIKNIVGTPQYKEAIQGVYNNIYSILNDENAVLTSFNGNVFDIPSMLEIFKGVGIDVSEDFIDKFTNKTIDMQQLYRGNLRTEIFRKQAELGIESSLSVENLAKMIGVEDPGLHLASTDTIVESSIITKLMNDLFKASDDIVDDIEKIPPATKAIYHATGAVQADKNDIFFSDSGYGNPNVYNRVLMEPGHSYKISSKSIKIENLPSEVVEQYSDFKDKKIIKIEDAYDGYNRTSYLLANSQEEIQDKILNSGKVEVSKLTEKTQDIIKQSTEIALKNKAMQTRDNFYRINSNKGYEDFKMYMDMYSKYTAKNTVGSKEDLKNKILMLAEGRQDEAIQNTLSGLFSKKHNSLVHERAFNLLNLYDDFNQNYNLYLKLLDNTESAAIKYSDNDIIYNRARTFGLSSAKDELSRQALNAITDDEALDYIISNDKNMSMLYNSRVAKALKNPNLKSTVLSKDQYNDIKRGVYKDYNFVDFDKTSDIAKNYIFGMEEIANSVMDFNGFDILSPDGDYTRLQAGDRNNLMKSIQSKVYGIKAENGIESATKQYRQTYLSEVAKNLHERGFIDDDTLDLFNKTETVQGMVDFIGNEIHSNKTKYNLLNPLGEDVDLSILSDEDFKFVNNYRNKHNMKRVYTEGNGYTILGKSAQDFFDERVKNIDNVIYERALKAVPNVMTSGYTGASSTANRNEIASLLKKELGWNDSHVDKLFKNVFDNKELSTFTYATSGKTTSGLSHTIASQDGITYLISTPFDKEAMVAEKIARGLNIGEINNVASIFELPKIEDYAGIPIIKQGHGDISYKAVTKDLKYTGNVLNENNHFVPKMIVEDTVDTVLNNLFFGFKDAKAKMEHGLYEDASSTLNRSWKKIHENKTLSAVTTRYMKNEDGVYQTVKRVTLNRADNSLSKMYDISDLVYSLDMVTSGDTELAKSFKTFEAGGNSGGVLEQVKKYKSSLNSKGKTKVRKKNFNEWDSQFKVWFAENIGEIANQILENESFMEYNPDLSGMLQDIKKTGIAGFLNKDQDTNRGYFFANSAIEYVAGANFSGVARPLVNQVTSAMNIHSDDMIALSNKKLPKHLRGKIKTKEDLDKYLGIRVGHGYITEKSLEFDKMSENFNNSRIGFSLKTKTMNSKEFLDNIEHLSKDSIATELLENKKFLSYLQDVGVETDVITDDYIRAMARRIATATNLYEDSSLISPFISVLMPPKSISSVNVSDSSLFKLDTFLETGTILETVNGKNNIYNKNDGKIVGIEKGKIFVQHNENYNNVKLGQGFEKTEAIAPRFYNETEMGVLDALIRYMGGDSRSIMNPDNAKHENFASILTGYANAIGYNIKDDLELETINKNLSELIPNLNLRYEKNNGRYSLIEGEKKGKVAYSDFEKFVNFMMENGNDDIKSSINDIKDNVSYLDFVLMQDNTNQSYNIGDGGKRGASVTYRSQAVAGSYIGGEELDDLVKYRKTSDGKMVNLWQPILDAEVEEIARDPKFITAQEQVQNIRVALNKYLGNDIENTNIVKISLDDVAVGSSIIDPYNLPEIFKYKSGNDRIHAYEIDLSDLNLEINNHFYEYYKAKDSNEVYKTVFKIKPTDDKLYIPALDANYMNEGYTLTKTQRKASDIINSLIQYKNGNLQGKSLSNFITDLNADIVEYKKSLPFELNDNDGLNKSSLRKKMEFSLRSKSSKVAAPITTSNNSLLYQDYDFRRTSTVYKDGRLKYYSSTFVSKEEFLRQGLSMSDVGGQLINENIDDSKEALQILKKHLGNTSDINNAKNMDEARKILKGNQISDDTFGLIGEDFLREVGVYGEIMRDPAFLTTSWQGTKIRIADIAPETFATDVVSANFMNLDSDGDENNIFFKTLYKDKNGKIKIRSSDDIIVKTISENMELYSDDYLKKFEQITTGYKAKLAQKKYTKIDIASYMDEMKKLGRDLEDVDYLKNSTKYAALMARFNKASIGQISNPNYYLKTATNYYYSQRPYDITSYKAIKSISALTNMTEQKLIDTKNIKNFKDVERVSSLASNYRKSIDNLASDNKTKFNNALYTLYKDLMYHTDDNIVLGYKLSDELSKIPNDELEKLVGDAVKRITSDNILVSSNAEFFTLEEILYYSAKALQDNDTRSVFLSQAIRQSNLEYLDGKEIDDILASERALNQPFDKNNKLFSTINNGNYLQNTPVINNKYLSLYDDIYSLDDNGFVGEGIYKVVDINRDGTNNYINLKNQDSDSIIRVTGDSFDDISKKISHMEYLEDETKFLNLLTNKYKNETPSSLSKLTKTQGVILNSNKETFRYKAAKTALEEYDVANLTDMLATVEVLKNKGYVDETDASDFIKNMNNSIRANGTKEYRQSKIANLLNLDSFRKSTKVSTSESVSEFLNKVVTVDDINSIVGNEKLKEVGNIIKTLTRTNQPNLAEEVTKIVDETIRSNENFAKLSSDEIVKLKKEYLDKIMTNLTNNDTETIGKLKEIISQNADDINFVTDVLGLDFDSIDSLITNNDVDKAVDMINKSKIAFGDFIGLDIGDLTTDDMNKILTGNYDKSGVSNDIVEKTEQIIKKMQNLKADGYDISPKVKPSTATNISDNTIVGSLSKELNEKIKNHKGNGKSKEINGKSIIDKISDTVSNSKNNKKLILGATAAVGAALVGSYLYGNHKINEKNKEYVSKNTDDQNGQVKTSENGNNVSGGSYKQVPTSNMGYYGNSDGMSVNVKAKSPIGTSRSQLETAMSKIFGGSGVAVNANISDSRREIEDRDVEEIMSMATIY